MGGRRSVGPGVGTGSWNYGVYNRLLLRWMRVKWAALVPLCKPHQYQLTYTDSVPPTGEEKERKYGCFFSPTGSLHSLELKEEKKKKLFPLPSKAFLIVQGEILSDLVYPQKPG